MRISDAPVTTQNGSPEMEARVANEPPSAECGLLEHPPLSPSAPAARPATPRGALSDVSDRPRRPASSAPASALPRRYARPEGAGLMCAPTLPDWRSIIRTLAAFNVRERAEAASGSGSSVPTKAKAMRTRSPRSASACGAGCSVPAGIAINVEPDLSHFSAIVPCCSRSPLRGPRWSTSVFP